jgi:hypothetical protein
MKEASSNVQQPKNPKYEINLYSEDALAQNTYFAFLAARCGMPLLIALLFSAV